MRLCAVNEHKFIYLPCLSYMMLYGMLMRRFCLSSHSLMAENCWGDVIIIHPSARDWKLFMYENNDVRRKGNYFEKNNKKDENAVERMSVWQKRVLKRKRTIECYVQRSAHKPIAIFSCWTYIFFPFTVLWLFSLTRTRVKWKTAPFEDEMGQKLVLKLFMTISAAMLQKIMSTQSHYVPSSLGYHILLWNCDWYA